MQRYEIINQSFLSSVEWNKKHISDFAAATDTAAGFAAQKKIVCIPEPRNLLFIYSKSCVLFNLFGSLIRTKLSHDSDGFIFTPIKCAVLQNTHATMFKWKPMPTIDVKVQHGKYFCSDAGKLIELSDAFPGYQFVFGATNGMIQQPTDDFIFEATIVDTQAADIFTCAFHRTRVDKKFPNDKRTIENVIKEIRENITLDELLQLSENAVSD